MNTPRFLVDTNTLITPYLNYYPFDFAPGFWKQLEAYITSGEIAILDLVKNEILQGNDSLSAWIKSLHIGNYFNHRDIRIISQYRNVLQAVQNDSCYKPSALTEWAKNTVADAWLIATAKVFNLTLITFERKNNNLSPVNPSKKAKIPNIASTLGVPLDNLFGMMRTLGFSLS